MKLLEVEGGHVPQCPIAGNATVCIHDYKSPLVVVVIRASLVNTQTDNVLPIILLAQLSSRAKSVNILQSNGYHRSSAGVFDRSKRSVIRNKTRFEFHHG